MWETILDKLLVTPAAIYRLLREPVKVERNVFKDKTCLLRQNVRCLFKDTFFSTLMGSLKNGLFHLFVAPPQELNSKFHYFF